MHTRARGTPLQEKFSQVFEMFREVGGEFVRGSVGISNRPGDGPVRLEEPQVVPDSAIVKLEGGRELMSVGR
jgi:hypothetical protein